MDAGTFRSRFQKYISTISGDRKAKENSNNSLRLQDGYHIKLDGERWCHVGS